MCCRGSGERSTGGRLAYARVDCSASDLPADRTSRPRDAVTAVEALGDAADEQYSRVEDAGDAEAAPDPASGGGGAA